MNLRKTTIALGVALLAGLAGAAHAQLIQTQTYQGRLEVSGEPAQGVHQIRLRVFDSPVGGSLLAEEIRTKNFAGSDNGLFTFADLSFGNVFDTGADRWIEISARSGTTGTFTVLGPRQPVTGAPTADVAHQLALPYADAASVSSGEAVFQIENTDPAGWAVLARSGPDSGVNWSSAAAVFDVAESGPPFGLITTGAQSAIAAAAYHPGTYGVQAERYAGNDFGAAVFVFDLADGNDAYFGTASYSGDFIGDVRMQAGVDILGEEIDRSEILDEPGVASVSAGSVSAPSAGYGAIVSRTITAPAAGFVIAIGSSELEHNHTTGTMSNVRVGVSTMPTSLTGSSRFNTIPGALPTGLYSRCVSDQAVFPVSAGTSTFYYVAWQSSGAGATLFDPQMTLIYVPSAYGAVSAGDDTGADLVRAGMAAPRLPMSIDQIGLERAAAEQRAMDEMIERQARIDRLVAEQRAALEALRHPSARQ